MNGFGVARRVARSGLRLDSVSQNAAQAHREIREPARVLLKILLAFTISCVGLLPLASRAQMDQAAAQAVMRDAVAKLEAGWNTHDLASFMALLTPDVYFMMSGMEGARHGREATADYLQYYIKGNDRRWHVARVRPHADGSITALVRGELLQLPIKDGKYSMVYAPGVSVMRWRLVNGEWKMYSYTNAISEVDEIIKTEALGPN